MIGDLLVDLTPHILGLLTVLGVYFINEVKKLILSKTTNEDRMLINDVVLGVVMFVEQIAKVDLKLVGQVKFDLAKRRALDILSEKGLEISDKDLQAMIERFVYEIKEEKQ